MKFLVVFGLAVWAAAIGIYKATWRLTVLATAIAPVPLIIWMIYKVNIDHWNPAMYWNIAPMIILSCLAIVSRVDCIDMSERLRELERKVEASKVRTY